MKRILVISFLCTFIDQVLKNLVTFNMDLEQSFSIIPHFFNITYVGNTGGAFSILAGNTWIFVIVAFVAINLIFHFFINGKQLNKIQILSYGILIGGILGNLVDRIFYGYVVDYLDFHIFGYAFPIFNFADICIVLSIIGIIYILWREEKCKSSQSKKLTVSD